MNTTTAWYGFYIADNGDEASTSGIELELNGSLTDSMGYHLGYTYVKAELEADFFSTQTDSLVAPKGSTLPGTPATVFTASMDYTWQLTGGMDLIGRANAYYPSESENFVDAEARQAQTHDDFWLFSGSLALITQNWDVTLYGKNLGDEEGITGAFPSSHWSFDTGSFESWYGNGNRQMITQPRTIGLAATYRF